MKRTQVRALAVFLGLIVAAGAAGYGAEVRLGAHGGLSIPDIRGNQTDIYSRNFTSREGPFFGIFIETRLDPHFSLVAELNYTSQGGLRKGLQPITMDLPAGLPIPPGTILYANFRNETILDYLEVPIMARMTFGNKLRYFINAGPYVGILIRARAETSGTSALYLDEAGTMPIIIPPDTQPLEVDLGANTNVRDSLKSTNIGLSGGGGLMYPVGPGDLILEAHFQLGLTVIQKDVETSGTSRTGAVVVSLGYSFPLSAKK
ncbi:MAG: porin family protein [Candidatus Aminicenantales bacterium]